MRHARVRLLILLALLGVLAVLLQPRPRPDRRPVRREATPAVEERAPQAPPAPPTLAVSTPDPLGGRSKPSHRGLPDRVAPGFTAAGDGGPAPFVLRDQNVSAFFTPRGIALALLNSSRPRLAGRELQGWGLHWGIVGAREVEPRAEAELPGRVSMLKGSPDRWKVGQKTYSRMVYPAVSPGIDLVVESRPHGLKYTLNVARAGDLAKLRLKYGGANEVRVVEEGAALEIQAGQGALREDGLHVLQGGRSIPARYVSHGQEEYGLAVDGADPDLPIEVDPVIGWSTYLGGTLSPGSAQDVGRVIKVDTGGNVFVGGYTYSADFPITTGPALGGYEDGFVVKYNSAGAVQWAVHVGGSNYDEVLGLAVHSATGTVFVTGSTGSSDFPMVGGGFDTSYSNGDGFVAKINASGTALLWSTFLGGNNSDYPQDLAIDASLNVYVTGYTYSDDFPASNGFDSSLNGGEDSFVTKIKSDGTSVIWSSFVGGSSSEYAYGIAVDGSDNAYITGYTYSADFGATAGSYDTSYNGGSDVFVAKVASTGLGYAWATYIGGSNSDVAFYLAIDSSSNVYVTGYTSPGAPNYPVTIGAHDTTISGTDAFVTKLDSPGTTLGYSTYLGGTSSDYGYGIAVDGSGQAVVTGITYSSLGFPLVPLLGTLDPTFVNSEAFVTKYNATGTGLVFSTYLGGSDYDDGVSVAVDASSNVYVTGQTPSPNFPVAGGLDTTLGGYSDAFVSKINAAGTVLTWSTYLGGANGPGGDEGRDVAVDASGNVYLAGLTYSSDFPDTPGAFQTSYDGNTDSFVAKYNSTQTAIVWATYLGGFDGDYLEAMAVDGSGNVYVTGSTYSPDFPTTFGPALSGGEDTFVTRLRNDGSALDWSRFLGGTSSEYSRGIALDPAEANVFVAGYAYSTDYPTTAGAFQTVPSTTPDAYVSRLQTSNGLLTWSTYMGGSDGDYAVAVRVDASNRVYVGGFTYSFNFPVSGGAYQTFNAGNSDLFVIKYDPALVGSAQRLFGTYIGGSNYESMEDLAIDGSGNVYVTGNTSSTNFPTTGGAFSTSMDGFSDGYVTKLNSTGTALAWSTFLGGTSDDYPSAIEVDAAGAVYVAGTTYSFDFPLKGAFQGFSNGSSEGFITKIAPTGSSLNWSSYVGGSDSDYLYGLALGSGGALYVAGYTYSSNYPKVNPIDGTLNGSEAFVTRIDNSNPNPPSSLLQFKLGGLIGLGVGAWSNEAGIEVKGTVNDSDEDMVRLRVEIKPLVSGFDGTGTVDSALFAPGSQASVTVPFPAGTQFHWRAAAVDSNGRVSSWVSFGGNSEIVRDVGQDTGFPTSVINSPTTNDTYATSATPIALGGTASDALSGVALVRWQNITTGASNNATGTTSWTIGAINLNAGPNTIRVYARDQAGNEDFDQIVVTLDTGNPTVSITPPGPGPSPYRVGPGTPGFAAGTLTLAGTATDTYQVASLGWVNSVGGSGTGILTPGAPSPPNWTWSAAIPLAPGTQTITVTATDGAGNSSQAIIAILYDNVPPTISITTPVPPSASVNGTPLASFAGTASDPGGGTISQVTWVNTTNSTNGIANGTTSWDANGAIPLAPGANLITVTAKDSVNNQASANITIYSDTANPTVTIVNPAPPAYTTGSSSVVLTGTSLDDIGIATIKWSRNGSAPVDAVLTGPVTARNWSATITGLQLTPVVNTVVMTVTDVVGKTGTHQIDITYDDTVPSLTITDPATSTQVTPNAQYTVVGTTSAAGAKTVFSVTVQNLTTGVFSTFTPSGLGTTTATFSAPVDLVLGENQVRVKSTDSTMLSTQTDLTIVRDPTPPAVTITGPTGADTYASGTASIPLSGVASDNRGITEVRWQNLTTGQPPGGATAALSGPSTSVTWSVSTIPLALGANTIRVTAKDDAGNTTYDELVATYDTAAPGITITTPTSAPTVSVTASPVDLAGTANDVVGLSVITWTNAATGASGSASGLDLWSIDDVLLNPGANVITVIAVDRAGNTQSDSITVYLDQAGPSISITSPAPGGSTYPTNSSAVSLAGTAADDIGVTTVTWQSVAGMTIRNGVTTGTTAWSIASIPLDPGDNVITVTAQDGVTPPNAASAVLTVRYDDAAPTLLVTSPAAASSSTTTTPLSLAGNATDNFGVTEVTWANLTTGGVGPATGTDPFSALAPLTSGTNNLSITARDAAGNTTTVLRTVIYDPAAPVVTILTPTTAFSITTGVTPITIGGISSDDVGVASVTWTTDQAVVPNGGTALGTTADWFFPVELVPGENLITVTATDGVGRTGTSFLTVVYDPSPPQVLITLPTDAATFNSTLSSVNLAGTATDNLNLQTVTWLNEATGAGGPVTGLGSWTVPGVTLNPGPNLITITATDGVNNVGAAMITVIYDNTLPTVSIDVPATDPFPTSTRPLTISGTAGDNLNLVSVTWVNSKGGGGTAFSGSTTSTAWNASVYLFPGDNTITVTATDDHGNAANDTIVIQFTPETDAPNIVITTPSATGSAVSPTQLVTVGGTADDAVGIVSVTWINQRTRVRGTATLNPVAPAPVTDWTADIPLANGPNVIVATALDDAGNVATATITITYTAPPDTGPPQVQITTPTLLDTWNESVSAMAMTVTATDAEDGIASVTWVNAATGGDGVATLLLGDTWITDVPLALGANVITVMATDASGNTAIDILTVTFAPPPGDSANPVVTITSHPTGATLPWTSATIDLGGTASDNVEVTAVIWLNGATVLSGTAEGTTTWAATLGLLPGINVVTMRVYDSSGNFDTDQITILYTPPPPPPEHIPGGHCGLLGLDAAAFLALLVLLRRRPGGSRPLAFRPRTR